MQKTTPELSVLKQQSVAWFTDLQIGQSSADSGTFQVALVVKNLTANPGDVTDVGWIPGSGESPGEMNDRQPIPVFLPVKSHGQRSLVDCSPWGHKELDTTQRLRMYT